MEIQDSHTVRRYCPKIEEHGQKTLITEVVDVIKKFFQKLTDCEYDIVTRDEVIKAGVRKFY